MVNVAVTACLPIESGCSWVDWRILYRRAFDLVLSALAVHHLEGSGKAGLFQRIASTLDPAGRFCSPTSWSRSIPRMS